MTKIYKKDNVIRRSTVIMFMYILTIFVYAFTAEYESVGWLSQVKYILSICTIIICVLYMNKSKQINIFKYEVKSVIWIIGAFAVISLIRSIYINSFTIRTFQELLFLLIPVIFSYCILNTLNKKQIDKCMISTLIIFMIAYFGEINMGFSEFISALTSMSFSNSYSMLESSTFAGSSIAISMYFIYFKKNKLAYLASIFFVILTFKRLAIVFVIFLIFVIKLFNYNKKVNYYALNSIKIIILLITILYYLIMIPKNVEYINSLFNIDLYKITMSRTYRFSLIYNRPMFINTGLGSTFTYLMNRYGVTLEMDFIKLLIEVTPIGLWIFINNMCNIVKKNWYCMLLMLFQFFNLITSHSLASTFAWTIFYLTIGCVLYKNE